MYTECNFSYIYLIETPTHMATSALVGGDEKSKDLCSLCKDVDIYFL